MFTQYASSVFDVVHSHANLIHGYADDHQIYNSFHPDCLQQMTTSMEDCISDVRRWMMSMKLKMNDAKTEYILIGTKQQLSKCQNVSITIGNSVIQPSDCIRNLGAYFDKNMSMEQHIKIKCKAAYAQLYNISKIRKYLDYKSAELLVHALVHSHIDYCNSLLVGLPKYLINKLQMVQNTAARVLCNVGKYEHITPTLKKLHWLPVPYRIKFKICLITFNALHGIGPAYIRDLLTIWDVNHCLRSNDALTLVVPWMKHKTLGDRAFRAAAPREWNALPTNLRNINDYGVFKKNLKTLFFQMAFRS